MYENQTEEVIKQRMLEAVPSDLDKGEGSFIYDAVAAVAIEFATNYIQLDYLLNRARAETATGIDLEKKVAEQGLSRKPAGKATGTVIATGSDGAIIPKGTIFSTKTGVQFVVTADSIINSGTAMVSVEAVKPGTSGNVPANVISLIPVALPGVTSVTNPTAFTNGYDAETDEDLRQRYFEKLRTPSTSGNKYHYINWAKEVMGVADAKVFPLWNGNGTVKVVVIDSNKRAADAALVDAVAAHIEENRPIGATVTVVSATEIPIDIAATVVLANGFTIQQVQDLFQSAVVDYFKSIAFVETYVSYAQLGSILLHTAGVGDYSGLQVNGGISNILLGDEEIPILNSVSLEVGV